MLFLCDLPTDIEPENKQKPVQSENNKIAMLIATVVGMVILIVIAGIMIVANTKTPQNVSPYCLLMKNEGKTCKIHHVKHEGKNLKQLVISENEMVLHQKLFDEVSAGAYFDGKKLYKEDDTAEIIAIYNTYQKEKELLFEGYLQGTLDEERKERYNIIIEELADLEETIDKFNIDLSDNVTLSRGELIQEIEDLKKQLAARNGTQSEAASTVTMMKNEPQTDGQENPALQEAKQNQQVEVDPLLYGSRPTGAMVIPSGIEEAATIKKSSLYQ